MASRKLVVEVIGDTRNLNRAFKQSSKEARTFGHQVDASAKSLKRFSTGVVAGFAGAEAFNILAEGVRDVIEAASGSQKVLGQTRNALEATGFTWTLYGKQIEDTIKKQSRFGFSQVELMKSFGVLIRASGSVEEAQRRTNIAMDIARARFIELDEATGIVARAALGGARAVKGLGIEVRKGATGVELLAQLEREFGGAAEAASDDASTAMDRFNASVEEAKTAIGNLLLPKVVELADNLTRAAEGAAWLVEQLNKMPGREIDPWAGVKDLIQPLTVFSDLAKGPGEFKPPWEKDDAKEGLKPVKDAWTKAITDFGIAIRGAIKRENDKAKPKKRGGITASQRNAWFDARIARELNRAQDLGLRKQLVRLKAIAAEVRARIAATSDITRRLTLEDQLLDITREQRSVQEQITDSIKKGNQALKDRAQAIKSAIIERLQRKQTDVLNKRALDDAQEQLRLARRIGGPMGIRAALRDVQDAQFDMFRARVENAPASLTRGGQFTLGGVITINVQGATDPEKVAQQVAAVLQRRGRRSTTQARGPAAGAVA